MQGQGDTSRDLRFLTAPLYLRTSRLAGALVLAASAWVILSGSASGEPAGTVVVPSNPGWIAPPVSLQLGNDGAGLVWNVVTSETPTGSTWVSSYRDFSGSTPQQLSTTGDPPDPATVEGGVAAVPQLDTDRKDGDVVLTPLAGGSSSSLPVAANETYLGFNGTGILVAQQTSAGVSVILRQPGAADLDLADLGAGTQTSVWVDSKGMLFGFQPALTGSGPVTEALYFDFADNSVTVENTDPADTNSRPVFMSSTLIGWETPVLNYEDELVWQSRSGGPQLRLLIGKPSADPEGVAVSGSTVAFTAHAKSYGRYALYLESADGSAGPTDVSDTLGANSLVPLAQGGFGVESNANQAKPHLSRVSVTGKFKSFQPISALPASLFGLTLSGGRVAYSDNSLYKIVGNGDEVPLLARQTTNTDGTISVGPQSTLATDVELYTGYARLFGSSDGRIVYMPLSNRFGRLMILDGTTSQAFSLPSGYSFISISGSRVLLHKGTTRTWSVIDTATGANTSISTTVAALWGPYVYYQGAAATGPGAGQLVRLDLDEPASSTNPEQILPGNGCRLGAGPLRAWDNLVVMPSCSGTPLQLVNADTDQITPIQGAQLQAMGDGVIAWWDGTNLQTMNLTVPSHPITTIGQVLNGSPLLWSLDTSGGQEIAWVAPDDKINITPLPEPASPPMFLDSHVDPSLTSGNTWNASFDLSKPVTWTLAVTDATNAAVRTLSGTALDGAIRAGWDGTDTGGTPVPAGTYTWTLTANGTDGVGQTTQTGTVAVS